jgi:hypothetical protein
MKLQVLAACAALATLTAAPAFAADTITAKLQQPVAEKTKFIAGGAMFICEGDACVAAAPTSQTYATTTCKTIAGKVGAIASFGGRKQMDEARIADCNTKAASSQTQLAKQ